MPGITPIADVPDAPTIGTATDVGTSRAYNNGSATVTYTAAATGGAVTTFTATSTPGSFTATGASPLTVTGLQSATSYTFAVSAANSSGTLTSASSSSITATTVPQAPTIGTFTDGGTGTSGTLSFTAGATGGSTITNYKYSTDSSTYTALSPSQTTSPLSLTGLTAGTYNFSVKAVNANGDSTASGTTSGTVIQPTVFESIATFSPDSTGSITFSSIPQTYKHLQIRTLYRGTSANGSIAENILIQFNGDTTANYAGHYVIGTNAASSAAGGSGSTQITVYRAGVDADSTAGTYGTAVIDLMEYASTSKIKTLKYFAGCNTSVAKTAYGVSIGSGLWNSTAAITSITVKGSANFSSSTVALYGIKG
jgi:trimeric autotransporter adhesin